MTANFPRQEEREDKREVSKTAEALQYIKQDGQPDAKCRVIWNAGPRYVEHMR